MQWNEFNLRISDLYQSAATWVYEHPVETDFIIVGGVILALVKFCSTQRRKYRRRFSLMRGSWMSEEQRRRLQRMRFEDALGDAALSMLVNGEMTPDDDKWWNHTFADAYKFTGMIPGPLSKEQRIRGALTRIKFYKRKLIGAFAGGPPTVKVDPTYQPSQVDPKYTGLSNSRFAKTPTE